MIDNRTAAALATETAPEAALATETAPEAAERRWLTASGIVVHRGAEPLASPDRARAELLRTLDSRRGLLLTHQGRLIGYTDPPLEITAAGNRLTLRALNDRGRLLLPPLRAAVAGALVVEIDRPDELTGRVRAASAVFSEEERTRQVGVFQVLRELVAALAGPEDLLGLYGAFGYDLLFALDPVELSAERDPADRTLVLHLPDELLEFQTAGGTVTSAVRYRYDFVVGGRSSRGLAGGGPVLPFAPGRPVVTRELPEGGYAEIVRTAMASFHSGELFEVVPSQVFYRSADRAPSELFQALVDSNPAPHSLVMNLGEAEYLIGASPEMFVDVVAEGGRRVVRSAPISGTIARGRDALHDAHQIRELLNSAKDECELTMCTDVDRNDKARVCVPGTVRVTGRREIVRYSRLIHTVDHVEGVLREDRDGLDAFLAHLWAVTVTGAPKLPAAEFIERHEQSPRRWYGGAVGRIGFDGSVNTVLTLRTMQLRDGVAAVRSGATVLVDSDPAAEEAETELKADALLRVLENRRPAAATGTRRFGVSEPTPDSRPPRVLVVDHRDSFVHCLADYLRQTGAEVVTYRSGSHLDRLAAERPDLVVLSPGPGRPVDFDVAATLAEAERLDTAVFGVCLGLQALAEYTGADLVQLGHPVHGKRSIVHVIDQDSPLFAGLPAQFEVGRYHSLAVMVDDLPAELRAIAVTDDDLVMAVEHRHRPFAAVQFHPESIMTADDQVGRRIIANVTAGLAHRPRGVLL